MRSFTSKRKFLVHETTAGCNTAEIEYLNQKKETYFSSIKIKIAQQIKDLKWI